MTTRPSAPRRRPALRDRSVFDGLYRRVVTQSDLVAHSVAVICPSASALSTAFLLPRVVGPGAWLSVVLGIGLSYLLTLAFAEFGSRFVAPGSLYTYAAKGLGPAAALVVGVSLLLGYAALVGYGLTDSGRQTGRAYEAVRGSVAPGWLQVVVVLAGAATCVAVMRRGIRYSTRFAFAAEAVALSLLVLILVVTALRHGLPDLALLSLEGSSLHDVLTGTVMVMTVTLGFESSAALGVEARQPFRAVPRSMRLAVLVTGVLMLAGVLVALGIPERGRGGGRWFHPGAEVSYLDAFALLVIAASYLALALCVWTVLTRLVFAFSREGLLPRRLGRTDARTGNPHVAVAATAPVVLLPTAYSLVRGEQPGWASHELLVYATVILLVAYLLVALAVLPFLSRLGELTGRAVAVAVAAASGTAVVGGIEVHNDLTDGQQDAVYALLAVAVVGVAWRVALVARPAVVDNVGRHEETLRGDVLLPGPYDGGGRA